MIEEKIYTQSDLNNAVVKAIADMSKVLEDKNKALLRASQLLADGYCVECNGNCAFSGDCAVNDTNANLNGYKPKCDKTLEEWKKYLEGEIK